MKYHTYLGNTIAWQGAGYYWFNIAKNTWLKTTRKTRRTHWIERDEIE